MIPDRSLGSVRDTTTSKLDLVTDAEAPRWYIVREVTISEVEGRSVVRLTEINVSGAELRELARRAGLWEATADGSEGGATAGTTETKEASGDDATSVRGPEPGDPASEVPEE